MKCLAWHRMLHLTLGLVFAGIWISPDVGETKSIRPQPVIVDTPSASNDYQVFAFNDLGMHCYDADFSTFCLLPPFNVVHAQVIRKGAFPELLGEYEVRVSYAATRDPQGSINTTSLGKTNFWAYTKFLFGVVLKPDVGLLNAAMPGRSNLPRPFREFDPQMQWFTAAGIPITDYDDRRIRNQYPLMSIKAWNERDRLLSSLPVVLPVSSEMNCSKCHSTGSDAASPEIQEKYKVKAWSRVGDPILQYRQNILLLHDAINGTHLLKSRPVLCASCHYSRALDLAGSGPDEHQAGHPFLSHAIHRHHAEMVEAEGGSGEAACYLCHPGSATRCLRGAMAAGGLVCQDCHGNMQAVGGVYQLKTDPPRQRRPWVDLPKCQSCHTGDALDNMGNIRLRKAYAEDDLAATPRIALNERFAEEPDKLYRFSQTHHGIACESCHGSTHSEWPVKEGYANDNLAATAIQGYPGPIIECQACHGSGQPLTTEGPHGLHNINDPAWNLGHRTFFNENCQACHGLNLEGTVLSRTATDRNLVNQNGSAVSLSKGTQVSCGLCHSNPTLNLHP